MSLERSEHSYIGLGDFLFVFFSGKSHTIFSGSNLIFRSLTSDFNLNSVIFFVKKKASALSNNKSVKVKKNVIDV